MAGGQREVEAEPCDGQHDKDHHDQVEKVCGAAVGVEAGVVCERQPADVDGGSPVDGDEGCVFKER